MMGKKSELFNKLPTSQMLSSIIDGAIKTKASYIHIEPQDLDVLVRFRVNGSLIEINRFSKKRFDSLLDRIKTLANLETRIRNVSQEGRFKIESENDTYTMRISILPTIDGEKISINILGGPKVNPSLEELGYWGHSLDVIKNSLSHRSGLILLTGPRDSGKSLSLISMLSDISDTDIKIATIEDPVEYQIPRATQTQVNHKTNLTFTNGLRSLEKHDNDVIMISELRDKESANLVFHYASRGKLILSTIYANNISEALGRLIDAGINHALVANTIKIISNQRLVRKLCETCKESFEPDKTNKNLLNEIFGLNDPANMKLLHNLESSYISSVNLNPSKIKDYSTTENKIKKLWRAHEGGCEDCLHTSYSGRIGIFEVIQVTPAIEKLILSLSSPKVMLSKAMDEGTVSLLADGLVKSLYGLTSINEIYRLYQEHF